MMCLQAAKADTRQQNKELASFQQGLQDLQTEAKRLLDENDALKKDKRSGSALRTACGCGWVGWEGWSSW